MTEIEFFKVGRGVSLLPLLTYDTQTFLCTLITHTTLHSHTHALTCTSCAHTHSFIYPHAHRAHLAHSCAHIPLSSGHPPSSPWDPGHLHVSPRMPVRRLDTHICTRAPFSTHTSKNYRIWSRPRSHYVVPELPMKQCPIPQFNCCYVSIFYINYFTDVCI